MKIRKELNRQLYRQKTYGWEKKPQYFDEAVLNAILDGDIETLKALTTSGAVLLPAGMRILSEKLPERIYLRFPAVYRDDARKVPG